MNISDRINAIESDAEYVSGTLVDTLYSSKPEIHILTYDKTDGNSYREVWLVENTMLIPVVGGINE